MKNLKIIHHLLKDEGLTIAGVKKKLEGGKEEVEYKYEISQSLLKIKELLLAMKESM